MRLDPEFEFFRKQTLAGLGLSEDYYPFEEKRLKDWSPYKHLFRKLKIINRVRAVITRVRRAHEDR